MRSTSLKVLQLFFLVILLGGVHSIPTVGANDVSTPAWTIHYSLSAKTAQPGGQMRMNLEIDVQKQVYDFDLQVNPGAPLTVDNGHIHFSSLSVGDIRKENFTINIPVTVQQGEVYVINFKAQSFPDPATILGRPPWESPDNVYDTTLKPEDALQVAIFAQPLLAISSFTVSSSTPTVGDSVTATLTLENTGTAPVLNVNATIQLPASISLTQGEPTQLLVSLAPGQSQSISWTFIPKAAGSYSIFLWVSSSNQKTVSGSQAITVNPSLWQQITTSGSLATAIFVLIVLFFIFMILRRRQY